MKAKAAEQNSLIQILTYWKIVRRYRWWIVFSTIALILAGVPVIALLPNLYEATTTILVDPQQIPERYVATTVVENSAQRLNTISQEVLSATRLEQIIDQYQLYPELRKRAFREDIIALMRRDITIQVKEGGSSLSAFTITYRSKDKSVVAPVTNALADGFIGWNLRDREQQVAGTTDFLKSELEKARGALKQQEGKLGHFKMQHAGELPDQQAANMQMLSQLQAQFTANREALNRLDVQRTLLVNSAANTPATPAPTKPVSERSQLLAEKKQVEAKLADLSRRYTSAFPDVAEARRRLAEINERLEQIAPDKPEDASAATDEPGDKVQLSIVDREIGRLNDEQKQITAQMKEYQARLESAPIREQQILDLSRNYDVSNKNYASLLDKTYASELAGELEKRQKAERFTILDPARTPERPVKPNRRALLVALMLGALGLAIATAFAWEMLNGTVKDEHDLMRTLSGSGNANATLLVTIPAIEIAASRRRRRAWLAFSGVLALLACVAEAAFLLRVRPIL